MIHTDIPIGSFECRYCHNTFNIVHLREHEQYCIANKEAMKNMKKKIEKCAKEVKESLGKSK